MRPRMSSLAQRTVEAPQGSTTVLRVAGLSKVYRTQTGAESPALRDVGFAMEAGEFVSVVGPSGCGKTTLMKICAGLLHPTAGEVDHHGSGRPVPPGQGGVVFQTPSLLPWRTILRNVVLPAEVLGLDRHAAAERARNLLGLVGLDGVESAYPGELSGGMQQRASICRALLHDPEILFMDEPFGALDALTREDLNMLLQDVHLHEHKTVLFITHSIAEAVLLSDRVLVMSGRPGTVEADLPVPFDRPRRRADVTSQEFLEVAGEIRRFIGRRDR